MSYQVTAPAGFSDLYPPAVIDHVQKWLDTFLTDASFAAYFEELRPSMRHVGAAWAGREASDGVAIYIKDIAAVDLLTKHGWVAGQQFPATNRVPYTHASAPNALLAEGAIVFSPRRSS